MLLSSAPTVLLSLLGLCGITLALPSPLEHAIESSQSTNLNAMQQAILAAHGQCDDSTDTCKKEKIDEKTALEGKTKCNVTCVSSSSYFFSALPSRVLDLSTIVDHKLSSFGCGLESKKRYYAMTVKAMLLISSWYFTEKGRYQRRRGERRKVY